MDYELPYQDKYGFCKVLMSAIGGDGANTIGKMLFEMGVREFDLDGGYDAKYGSEKQGTPTSVSIRLCPDDVAVRTSGPTNSPHILVAFYPSIAVNQGFVDSLEPGGTIALNTTKDPRTVRDELQIYSGKVITLDAGSIVDATGSRLNMPMLGILASVLDFPVDKVREAVAKKWPNLKDTNLDAFNQALDQFEVEEFEPKEEYKSTERSDSQQSEIGYENMPYGGSLQAKYFLDQPHEKRMEALGSEPDFDKEICINCGNCVMNCPDPGALEFEDGEMKGINPGICKRCMRCVDVCPQTKQGQALTRPAKSKEEAE